MMRPHSPWPYTSDGSPIWRAAIDEFGCPEFLNPKKPVYPKDGNYNNTNLDNLSNSPHGMYPIGYRLSQSTFLTREGKLVNRHNEPYEPAYLDNSHWPAYMRARRIIPSLMFEYFNVPKLGFYVYPKDGNYNNTHPSNYTFEKNYVQANACSNLQRFKRNSISLFSTT